MWEENIASQTNLIMNLQALKERSVVKMYALGGDPLPKIDVRNVIFITRANLKSMKSIADVIKHEEREKRREFWSSATI